MKNVGEPVPRRLTVQYALLRIFGINFSNLINFEQTAICLLGILLLTLAVCLRSEGGHIVTCRVARLSQDHHRIDQVFCCECGSANLDADRMCPATRCINCGCIEDAVVRANRLRPPVAKRSAPHGMVGKGGIVFLRPHSERYGSI